jgi:hypothetical protein
VISGVLEEGLESSEVGSGSAISVSMQTDGD